MDTNNDGERDPEDAPVASDFLYDTRLYVESPEVEVLRRELLHEFMRIFEKALRDLSTRDRLIVVRYFVLRESAKDISGHTGIKLTTVYWVIRRVKNIIRDYMSSRGFFTNGN